MRNFIKISQGLMGQYDDTPTVDLDKLYALTVALETAE